MRLNVSLQVVPPGEGLLAAVVRVEGTLEHLLLRHGVDLGVPVERVLATELLAALAARERRLARVGAGVPLPVVLRLERLAADLAGKLLETVHPVHVVLEAKLLLEDGLAQMARVVVGLGELVIGQRAFGAEGEGADLASEALLLHGLVEALVLLLVVVGLVAEAVAVDRRQGGEGLGAAELALVDHGVAGVGCVRDEVAGVVECLEAFALVAEEDLLVLVTVTGEESNNLKTCDDKKALDVLL